MVLKFINNQTFVEFISHNRGLQRCMKEIYVFGKVFDKNNKKVVWD
jgi:hypothetical protein